MAIDTDNEKFALIDMGDIWTDSLPISADGIGQADKQQLLWEYPGILWEGFDAVSRIKTIAATDRVCTVPSVTRTCTPASPSRTFTAADD